MRPVKNLIGVQARFTEVDMVLIRENTEDLYAGLEHTVIPGVVESLKIITEKASTRIAKFAFEYARANIGWRREFKLIAGRRIHCQSPARTRNSLRAQSRTRRFQRVRFPVFRQRPIGISFARTCRKRLISIVM